MVLVGSNLVLAAGVLLLAVAQGPVLLFAAWALLGLGMAMGLYEPAFATLARLFGGDARSAITGITLIAGFASTIGWPPAPALFGLVLASGGAHALWLTTAPSLAAFMALFFLRGAPASREAPR